MKNKLCKTSALVRPGAQGARGRYSLAHVEYQPLVTGRIGFVRKHGRKPVYPTKTRFLTPHQPVISPNYATPVPASCHNWGVGGQKHRFLGL